MKAEVGRTIEDITQEIQKPRKQYLLTANSEVRLNTDGITYYILGDVETIEISGEKST